MLSILLVRAPDSWKNIFCFSLNFEIYLGITSRYAIFARLACSYLNQGLDQLLLVPLR